MTVLCINIERKNITTRIKLGMSFGTIHMWPPQKVSSLHLHGVQCDQRKIAKCPKKLPKNNFTRKIKDFGTYTKKFKTVGDLGKLIVAKGFKKVAKVQ